MQGKQLYEYATIRFVPNVEREEFVNVGVILFSKRNKYLKIRYQIDPAKIQLFSSETDLENLQQHLEAFEKIANGEEDGGAIASFDTPERFRWLTAVRSAAIRILAFLLLWRKRWKNSFRKWCYKK